MGTGVCSLMQISVKALGMHLDAENENAGAGATATGVNGDALTGANPRGPVDEA